MSCLAFIFLLLFFLIRLFHMRKQGYGDNGERNSPYYKSPSPLLYYI
jgi:hypothetical protein